MANRHIPRSENGRIAVDAGYQPGTKEYNNFVRNLQRATTEAGQRRTPQAATLSKLAPEQARRILAQKAVRDSGGARGLVGKRVVFKGKIEAGSGPYEAQRARQTRSIQSGPITPEGAAALKRGDLGEFLSLDFWGAPVGTDGQPVAVLDLDSVRIV